MNRNFLVGMIALALVACGCNREPGSTTLTKGTLTIGCDLAVYPAMQKEVETFTSLYPNASIKLIPLEARAAVAEFASDSLRVIVCGRAFNTEERNALQGVKIQFDEYKVALSAVAVIANKENPLKQLRMGELDSIFTGEITRWPGWRGGRYIDAVIGGVNSSVNEVFRAQALHGTRFALSATPIDSCLNLVEYVRKTPNAVGIVGVGWLKGVAEDVNILALGSPDARPDTTAPPGQYYTPAQAYVFQEYYPLAAPVYIYSREVSRDLALGFISFVSSAQGQKVIVESGLVPVTMPVRLVHITSQQVTTQ